jgi:hypothetical protein
VFGENTAISPLNIPHRPMRIIISAPNQIQPTQAVSRGRTRAPWAA